MNTLDAILDDLRKTTQPSVLATLVRVKGSAYRKPGARMILDREGPRMGVVSGGCLENDLAERTKGILANAKPALVKYELGLELDLIWGTGMGCDGTAEILLQPLDPGKRPAWIDFMAGILEKRQRGVLITVFAVQDDCPFPVGEVFAYDEDLAGRSSGVPELDEAFRQAAHRCLQEEAAFTMRFPLPGGSLEACIEPVLPRFSLYVYGAGESTKPLARFARELGWFFAVLDHRPGLATQERFPSANRVISGLPKEIIPGLPMDHRSAALVVSHVYDRDQEALRALLDSNAAYVGLQGSRRRSAKIVAELEKEAGPLTEAQKGRLFYPVGLDIGAEAPEAIALSMVAEIQMVLSGRQGGHLKDRQGCIHG